MVNAASVKAKFPEKAGNSYDKFPDYFRMGIWNYRRLLEIQYGMRWLDNFLWFHVQMNSYNSNWNTPN